MKLLLRLTPMVLIVFGLFFIIGCEDTDEDVVVNPLVGTWDFTNMEQSAVYTAANSDLAAYGINAGDTLGSGVLDWATFSAMGVNGVVAMLEDGSFDLTGNFPIASDTLGFAPSIVPLTDAGTWTEDTDAGTLLIDGAFYDLGGLMTLSDGVLSLVYAAVEPDTVTLPVAADLNQNGVIGDDFISDVPINNASTTTLGFTQQ